MSVVKAKTALHADRLDMHAARITDLEEILGKHIAAVYIELSQVTERVQYLEDTVHVIVEAVDKLTRISDSMDSEFSGRLSFLEVIAE